MDSLRGCARARPAWRDLPSPHCSRDRAPTYGSLTSLPVNCELCYPVGKQSGFQVTVDEESDVKQASEPVRVLEEGEVVETEVHQPSPVAACFYKRAVLVGEEPSMLEHSSNHSKSLWLCVLPVLFVKYAGLFGDGCSPVCVVPAVYRILCCQLLPHALFVCHEMGSVFLILQVKTLRPWHVMR